MDVLIFYYLCTMKKVYIVPTVSEEGCVISCVYTKLANAEAHFKVLVDDYLSDGYAITLEDDIQRSPLLKHIEMVYLGKGDYDFDEIAIELIEAKVIE